MDANYYTTYLKAYLTDAGDARKDDDDQKSMRYSAVPVLHQPAPRRWPWEYSWKG